MIYTRQHSKLMMTRKEDIVVATFKGPANTDIMQKFASAIDTLIEPFNGRYWALICVSDDLEAATPDAEEVLVKAIQKYVSLGCRASAYIFPLALSRYQMNRALINAGIKSGIEGKNFPTYDQAEKYVHSALQHHSAYLSEKHANEKQR